MSLGKVSELVAAIRSDSAQLVEIHARNEELHASFSQLCAASGDYSNFLGRELKQLDSQLGTRKAEIAATQFEIDRVCDRIQSLSCAEIPNEEIFSLREEYLVRVRNLAYAEFELQKARSCDS